MANSEIIGAGQDTARRAPKKYKIIYADPPWSYSNFQGKGKSFGDVSAHYKTMSLDEMKELKISDISDSDCMLFMWATYPNLPEAILLLQTWGFKYKTVAFTWVKTRGKDFYSGLGFYTNSNCEICLIGRRGKFVRNKKNVKQLIVSPIGRHSEKPAEIRDRIVELCGDIPRIELFARQRVEGWDAWGNEIEESPVLGEESPAQDTMEICHTAPNSKSTQCGWCGRQLDLNFRCSNERCLGSG